ncbi:hypothetical protein OIU76_013326 [Salix suchowensis]|nr:hypothetical protein OIU76_013326 [Salix suchowensis]KAJ6317763.1 hypothetical protein OIU76_013326 [Salix suchowensis]
MRGTLLANRRGIQRFRQIAITAVKSSNIKFLLFCCIALTLVMAATRASDFMGWTNPGDSLDQFLPPGKGYAIWSLLSRYGKGAPDAMVGFVPRAHWVDKTLGKKDYYTYGGWWSVWCTGTYSMVLSKAAFFHKKYLRMYTNEMPVSIKAFVTKNRNCEDIAMSFLVANATGAPPIWVKGKRSILL